MFLAAYMVVTVLPEGIGFGDALHVSGKLGKLNVITTGITEKGFNWSDQYNLLSGIIGGFFLALSYFGADQSQVGRYLTARSLTQSRMGLLMNGFVKVPMQFLILLIGALVFTFYQFNNAPIIFNQKQITRIENSALNDSFHLAQARYNEISVQKQQAVTDFVKANDSDDKAANEVSVVKLRELQKQSDSIRGKVKGWINSREVGGDGNDTNY